MADSVYKVIRLVGSSPNSWEEAARNAEIQKLDLKVEDGKVVAYRALVNLSFKYGGEG
jgi:flavin-binding protein dodecin